MVVHLFLNNNKALDFLPINSIKNGGITIFVAKKQLGTSRGMPWQDGFSAMHFYNKLKNIIPQQSNSSLDAIHYASPGYMKMRMDSDIANTTYEAIEKYKQEKSIIDPIYNELSNRIKELDLNIVKLLYYSYKIRKKLEITHRLSRSTILYAYV